MNIQKFDATDIDEVKAFFAENEDIRTLFLNSHEKFTEGVFVARQEGEIAGVLSLNKFDSRRVDMTIYVAETYRRKGIGTALLRFSDKVISDSPFEHAYCTFPAEEGIAEFLCKNGYRLYCSFFDMERESTLIESDKLSDAALLERGIIIRNYQDDDYIAYHNVSDVAFYLLRQKLGLTPPFYLPPLEEERERLARAAANRYVMVLDGKLAAIGAIGAANHNQIHVLAVRPDMQQHGYGRILASYLNNKIIKDQNPAKVKISVIGGNPAKKLYESLGFRDVSLSYEYIKYYKPDSRSSGPKRYASEEEILNDLRLYGMLKEE